MEKIINYLHYANPIAIVIGIVLSLAITIKLYRDAPERKGLGFSKYWQALMMDSFPSDDKSILIYEDSQERFALFKAHRVVAISVMSFIGLNIVLGILLD